MNLWNNERWELEEKQGLWGALKRKTWFLCIDVLIIADSVSALLVKLSWPKTLVKKWFNFKNKTEEFQADDVVYGGNCWSYLILDLGILPTYA